jgi:outer membrane protein assembly factor BamB
MAVALAAVDGDVRWSAPGSRLAGPRAWGAGTAVLADDEGRIVARDAATGRERWDAAGVTEAAVVGDVTYSVMPGGVAARRTADGDVRWRVRLDLPDPARTVSVDAAGDTVFVAIAAVADYGD